MSAMAASPRGSFIQTFKAMPAAITGRLLSFMMVMDKDAKIVLSYSSVNRRVGRGATGRQTDGGGLSAGMPATPCHELALGGSKNTARLSHTMCVDSPHAVSDSCLTGLCLPAWLVDD